MTAPVPADQTSPVSLAPAWAELAGQQAAVEQLSRAAAAERPTHAWLFTGPPGSGRSNAARAFARRSSARSRTRPGAAAAVATPA